MINPSFQRLALLTGNEVIQKLTQTCVIIVGVGGVGSWCAEALIRSGLGKIGIIDSDIVCDSNINRQVQATSRTLGQAKVEALKTRLLEINPLCEVTAWEKTFSRDNAAEFNIEQADFVIDAIDTLSNKLDLIEITHGYGANAGLTLFSSMGMARKMDPTRIKTADIWKTNGDPLARLVREGLRKRGFKGNFTAVFSDEQIEQNFDKTEDDKKINGSVVTVTASAGMVLASLILQDIAGRC